MTHTDERPTVALTAASPSDGQAEETPTVPLMTRAEYIAALFPLVRRLAYHVRAMVPGAEIDDLVGDGTVGLIRAVDTFDAARGASLERYARQVVIGAMLNGLRKRDPVSERARRTLREADRVMSSFAHEHGRLPSARELNTLCVGVERALLAVHAHTPLSLDAPLPPGIRATDCGVDPAEVVTEHAARTRVARALAQLPARERRVVEMHYHSEVPLRKIGTCLGVSSQRASQLHLSALSRLRKALVQDAC